MSSRDSPVMVPFDERGRTIVDVPGWGGMRRIRVLAAATAWSRPALLDFPVPDEGDRIQPVFPVGAAVIRSAGFRGHISLRLTEPVVDRFAPGATLWLRPGSETGVRLREGTWLVTELWTKEELGRITVRAGETTEFRLE